MPPVCPPAYGIFQVFKGCEAYGIFQVFKGCEAYWLFLGI
jgi:hypothetical protein